MVNVLSTIKMLKNGDEENDDKNSNEKKLYNTFLLESTAKK